MRIGRLNKTPHYDVFISYRRDGGFEMARHIWDHLKDRGYRVFLDLEDMRSGRFNTRLYAAIEQSKDFVLILSPHSLDRCHSENDWLRLEIAHALKHRKNIIPILTRGFGFPEDPPLPEDICEIRQCNGLSPSPELFSEFLVKLEKQYLSSRPARTRWRTAGIILAIPALLTITGVGLTFGFYHDIVTNRSTEDVSEDLQKSGQLEVKVNARNASVSVNQVLMGVASPDRPLRIVNLPAQEASVTVEVDGQAPLTRIVRIAPEGWAQESFLFDAPAENEASPSLAGDSSLAGMLGNAATVVEAAREASNGRVESTEEPAQAASSEGSVESTALNANDVAELDKDVADYNETLWVGKDATALLKGMAPDRLPMWQRMMEGGRREAVFFLAICYAEGFEVPVDRAKALELLQSSASDDCVQAQNSLAITKFEGKITEKDEKSCIYWFRRASDLGFAPAQHNLGICYLFGRGIGMDEKQALALFRAAAAQGYPPAQYNAAHLLLNGIHVDRNEKEAAALLHEATLKGLAEAQKALGDCYADGVGVEPDAGRAFSLFRKAAEQGLAKGQFALGECYRLGTGVAQDSAEAFAWYEKAAQQGMAEAQVNVGIAYENGQGVDADMEKAVHWYRKAAEQGLPQAQCNLGTCYSHGRGVPRDPVQAVEWYQRAAEHVYAAAQFNLGDCYRTGVGVDKNDEEAVNWYRKAAEQGFVDAIYNLGACYANGVGVPKDEKEALVWYHKAAGLGSEPAKEALRRRYN